MLVSMIIHMKLFISFAECTSSSVAVAITHDVKGIEVVLRLW